MLTVTPSLRTARTLMQPFTAADVGAAHEVFGDAKVMRFAAGDPDPDLAATSARLQRYMALQRARGFSKWAVRSRSGVYLGDAGLTVLEESEEIELGYRLGPQYWGKGLATEIAHAWLGYARDELKLPRIIGFADPRNPASVRVLEKIGMTFVREDHLAGMDCVVFETTW